jgi:hypothetical protein
MACIITGVRMKFFRPLLAAFVTVLFCAGAGAQFRLPREKPGTLTIPPSASAQPAAASASASAAPAASAPGDTVGDKEAAGKLAASGWLVLLDRRDWGRAWETASTTFRTTVPLATWMDNVPKVRDGLGALVDRAPAEMTYKTSLPGRPPGEYVTVLFLSKFENKQEQEVVTTVREADGHWRVTGYSTQ